MLKLERNLLFLLALILSFTGALFVYEASAVESFKIDGTAMHFALTQLASLALGIGLALAITRLPPQFYLRWPYLFYFGSLILLGLCFWDGIPPILVGNRPLNGAYRWLWLFGVSFQVAEVVKFGLIVFFSYLLTKTKDWRLFLFYLIVPALLILKQHDFGSLLVICPICFGLFFLSGAKVRQFLILGAAVFLAAFAFIKFTNYRTARLECWLDPQTDPSQACYHVLQMQIAIGRGGFWGQGIGASLQKYYIPETSSDSIFAIIAEEAGFFGVSVFLGLYSFFLYLIWRLTTLALVEKPVKLIGYGIFLLFACQAFVNLAGAAGLIPLTGLTLPFFSAGGSSLVISWCLVAVVGSFAGSETEVKLNRRQYG